MPNFSSRIKQLRTERGITQEQLASMLKVSRSTKGMHTSGKHEPDCETSEAIADIFNVDMDFLMGRSDVERKHPVTPTTIIPPGFQPIPELDTVPIVGRIACGTPILAEQNIDGVTCIPHRWRATFVLTCKGRSEEHTSELQSRFDLVCRLLLEKKKNNILTTNGSSNYE